MSQRRRRPARPPRERSHDQRIVFRRAPGLTAFTAAYLAIAAVAVVVVGNREFAFYLVSLGLIIAAVVAIDRRVQFSPTVLWCLSLWGALHLTGGLAPLPEGWPYDGEQAVFYSLWLIPGMLKYDHCVHAFGFGTAAVAALQAMHPQGDRSLRPTLGMATAAALVACGLGSVNEILEFIATRISPETNVGGYVNTALDLVSNAVGAALAMVLVGLTRRSD